MIMLKSLLKSGHPVRPLQWSGCVFFYFFAVQPRDKIWSFSSSLDRFTAASWQDKVPSGVCGNVQGLGNPLIQFLCHCRCNPMISSLSVKTQRQIEMDVEYLSHLRCLFVLEFRRGVEYFLDVMLHSLHDVIRFMILDSRYSSRFTKHPTQPHQPNDT